jgi:hypothetical protein
MRRAKKYFHKIFVWPLFWSCSVSLRPASATDRKRVTGILTEENAMNKIMFAGLALAAVLAINTGGAQAAESAAQKACADEWAQLKTDNKIPSGTTWPIFEKDCMAKAAAATPAAPDKMAPAAKIAAPATVPAAAPAKMAAPAAMAPATKMAAPDTKMAAPAAGTSGEQSRIKTCAGQWDAMKAANKVPAGTKWPEFWHDCDTKLKAAGQ